MSPEYRFYVTANFESDEDAKDLGLIVGKLRGVEIVDILLPLGKELEGKTRHVRDRRREIMTLSEAKRLLEDPAGLKLGQLAEAFRVSKGLRIQDLASKGGPSMKTVSLIERGLFGFGANSVTRYVTALGLSEHDPMTELMLEKEREEREERATNHSR